MRILYDGLIYTTWPTLGISRYFTNLISRLPEDFRPTLTVCQNDGEIKLPSHPNLKPVHYKRYGFRPGRLSCWLEKRYFRAAETFGRPEVVHPTYYSNLTRRDFDRYRRPVVVTVYDMIYEKFPRLSDPTGARAEVKRQAVAAAEAVICISEHTKNDLLERYPDVEEKVRVIHLATEFRQELSYGGEPVPSRPYFLYVGHRTHHKNFLTLLSSFAKVVSLRPGTALCVVGPNFTEAEKGLVADLRLTGNVEHFGRATDTHLAKLYRCSVALVYPSLYEGFGMPLLEAMSCGAAVIASNRASIPEVVGKAALLVEPDAEDDMADAMTCLLGSPSERDRLVAEGRRRANDFSWDKTVSRTVEVYRSVSSR